MLITKQALLFVFVFYHTIYTSLFNPHNNLKGSTRVLSVSPESPERLQLSCRSCRFDLWSGSQDPMCLGANKQILKENISNIVTNSIKTFFLRKYYCYPQFTHEATEVQDIQNIQTYKQIPRHKQRRFLGRLK